MKPIRGYGQGQKFFIGCVNAVGSPSFQFGTTGEEFSGSTPSSRLGASWRRVTTATLYGQVEEIVLLFEL